MFEEPCQGAIFVEFDIVRLGIKNKKTGLCKHFHIDLHKRKLPQNA